MKYTTLILIQLFSIVFLATAQNTTVCAVKYKEYKTNLGTYNYWFYKEKYIHVKELNPRAQYVNGFPVIINGVQTTQTDTVKYNKEFNELFNVTTIKLGGEPKYVELKFYNSDTTKKYAYLKGLKKEYIITDILQKMDTWEILDDTMTFMGYKCQKAFIRFKQQKYYYAWFTIQLPYSAGPDEFRGLPGLILKVYDFAEKVGFEAIEILKPYKGIIPIFNSNCEVITKKDWYATSQKSNDIEEKEYKNWLEQLRKDGAIFHE